MTNANQTTQIIQVSEHALTLVCRDSRRPTADELAEAVERLSKAARSIVTTLARVDAGRAADVLVELKKDWAGS